MFTTPKQVLDAWLKGVNAHDVDSLQALYDPAAILLPTFSNNRPATPGEIREYFVKLAQHPGLAITLHEKTVKEQRLSDAIHMITGIYCWQFEIDGELLSFESRFSFTLNLEDSHPILHHHSSQVPRML